jgi:uncharacterized protein (TIGR03083 family)
MDRGLAISSIEGESARMLDLAMAPGADLSARVPSCPDWEFEHLLSHLAGVFNWVGTIVELRSQGPPGGSAIPARPEGTTSPEWLTSCRHRLLTALQTVPADALIWNFGPSSPASAEFWWRRQLHETVIHRVDAELAAGAPVSSFEPELAADTVSEVFTLLRFSDVTDDDASPPDPAPDAGETLPGRVHLHATDVDGAEWTIDTAARTVSRRHAKGDVAIRGSAWALARWCWGRPVDGEIETFGDLSAAEAWRASVVF